MHGGRNGHHSFKDNFEHVPQLEQLTAALSALTRSKIFRSLNILPQGNFTGPESAPIRRTTRNFHFKTIKAAALDTLVD